MGGSAQVIIDAASLVRRTEGAVTYQIATALQSTLRLLLDPEYSLACVLLMCIFTECASRVQGVDVSIAKQVLLSQLGFSFISAVDYALSKAAVSTMTIFLLRTYTLCLPSVIGAVSPAMLADKYVQTAIVSYVYRYAQNSKEIVNGIDWGATPIYLCLLGVVVFKHRAFVQNPDRIQNPDRTPHILTYVFQGFQLLLLDVLTQTVFDSAVRAPKLARTVLTLGLVVAVDLLCPTSWNTLQNVRSYAVLKAAQQINRFELLYFNAGNTFALAILLLCTRSAITKDILIKNLMPKTQLHDAVTMACYAIADVVCVASINVILQDFLAESVLSSRVVQFLSVSVTAVVAFSIQKILQS